jgi:hypothetical protein
MHGRCCRIADQTDPTPCEIVARKKFNEDAIDRQIMALVRCSLERGTDNGGNEAVPSPDNDFVVSAAKVIWKDNGVTMIRKVSTQTVGGADRGVPSGWNDSCEGGERVHGRRLGESRKTAQVNFER